MLLNNSMLVKQKKIYTPYCYLLRWSKQNLNYYGVRYARSSHCMYDFGCHPDDLWVKYYSSSAPVKRIRQKYGEPDIIQIRKTFKDRESAIDWENKVLYRIKAVENPQWLNQSTTRAVLMGHVVRRKISCSNLGKIMSAESRAKISKTRLERKIKHTEETRKKLSDLRKGVIGGVWSKPFIFKHNDNVYEFVSVADFTNKFGRSAISILRTISSKYVNTNYTLKKVRPDSKHIFSNGDVLFFSWKHS
jgi:hypothetical protein